MAGAPTPTPAAALEANGSGHLTTVDHAGAAYDPAPEAVLQRAPTLAEVTASEALQSAEGAAVMIAAIVDSAEGLTNVDPILQMFDLAFGRFPKRGTDGGNRIVFCNEAQSRLFYHGAPSERATPSTIFGHSQSSAP